MKNQQALKIGLGLALGAYIYEVIKNLLDSQSISNALINLDWKRVIFIGFFGAIISYVFYKPNEDK